MALNIKNPLQNRTKDKECGYLQGIVLFFYVNYSLQSLVYFFQVEGAKSTSMGKSSSLPASILNISTSFEKGEKKA